MALYLANCQCLLNSCLHRYCEFKGLKEVIDVKVFSHGNLYCGRVFFTKVKECCTEEA